ncbi:MAG: FAD-dependent oxidoreductase [Anaerolineae bacterium]
MRRAIVVGSGAGGATVARELQGAYDVTVLEAGREFHPLGISTATAEKVKSAGLLRHEREIGLFLPAMHTRRAADGMVLVNGVGLGGTTTLSAGNALRMDGDLRAIGIDLDAEFEQVYRDIPVTTAHEKRWPETTRRLHRICTEMGLDPQPIPKMGRYERCTNCGRCVLGCPYGVKWDSRQFLDDAEERGARVVTGCRVESVAMEGGRATGVWARQSLRRQFYAADLVVLAAGGMATPVILQQSGIATEPRLFVDPVLCVAARWPGAEQQHEMTMPFVVQRPHYIISPYFDYLSFFFNRSWRVPAGQTLTMMVKLADECRGSVIRGRTDKVLTAPDHERLREGAALCRDILAGMGVSPERTFLGTVNAGHPGGMLPLTEREADTLHHERLPRNLYVADATLLPRSLGNPPILTIVALAKKVSRACRTL